MLDTKYPTLSYTDLHADLFRDNVLFDGPRLAGPIDSYNACSGRMLCDLTTTPNDWYSSADSSLGPTRVCALFATYANRRPFTALGTEYWPSMLQVAYACFWLSRLITAEVFVGQDAPIHDLAEFEIRLVQWQSVEIHLPLVL